MEILLKRELNADYETFEVEENETLEDILKRVEDTVPYTILAAKVNNNTKPLRYRVIEPGIKVEFLDMRTQIANLIYQNSLCLIYMRAVYDVLNVKNVDIGNSINKGLYTVINTDKEITEEQVQQIEARMHEIVDADMPIHMKLFSRREAINALYRNGMENLAHMLEKDTSEKMLQAYTLEGFAEYFSYEYMVPSTGYIKYFQLMKYKDAVLLRFPHPSAPDVIPPYEDEHVLSATFEEQAKWGEITGVRSAVELNECIENGSFSELVQLSEALHQKKIVEIAEEITKLGKRVVLIAGPSSSGKTTFARRLCIQLAVNGLKPLYLGTDDYFVEREDTPLDENGERDYENINTVDIKLFNKNLSELLEGKDADIPTFNFITGHKEFGKRITHLEEGQPIVIEGIHALNKTLTPDIDDSEKYKIYISPLTAMKIDDHNRVVTTDHRMLRRMVRDYKFRAHTAQSTISDWPKVRKAEDKNLFPYTNEADVMFNSCHIYEISVLKKYAEPLLQAIRPEEPEFGDARRMLNFLRFFKTAESDAAIPNNSILREFIGDSIFVD